MMRGGDGFTKVQKWGPAEEQMVVTAVVIGGARCNAYIWTRQCVVVVVVVVVVPPSGTLLDLLLVRRFGRRLLSSSS